MRPAFRVLTFVLTLFVPLSLCAQSVDEKTQEKARKMVEPGGEYADLEYVSPAACAECHEDYVEQISHRKRGQAADPRRPFAAQGCETCHGPGKTHIENISEGKSGIGAMISFTGEQPSSVDDQNAVCTECHKGDKQMHWRASIHESEDLACVDCHVVHRPSRVLERTTQAEVCYECHRNIRAQTYRASTHPIREGKVVCSDCHNPHGSAGPAELNQLSINDNCYACHAEKRGPFLWEHYPVTEDCTLCHKVHGSSHPALLTKQGPQLCQECHANIRATDGRTHVRVFYDFDLNDPPGGAAGGTARGRFVVGENCMNCHSQVHGSNHPSGVNFQR